MASFVSWKTGTWAALLGGAAGGLVLVVVNAKEAIGTLLDFLFVSLGWLFFLVSSPELMLMGVLVLGLAVALTRSNDVFSFLSITFTIVFGFLEKLIKLMVLVLGVLISFVRVFRG